MIYEAKDKETVEQAARAAVQAECDKFRHDSDIYEIGFTYRKIEYVKMTEAEATRRFGDK